MLSERQLRWARAWYDPSIKLTDEDWLYMLYLSLACLNSFGIGILIGGIVLLLL